LGLIFLIEVFSNGSDLPMFELADFDRAPSLGGSDERAEHQFQDGSLAERVRDDLETTAFLDKKAFQQVRGPNSSPMRDRESQVGDTGFEVVHEAGDRAVVFAGIFGDKPSRKLPRNGSARLKNN
jgi:hypothetical protein